MFDFIWSEITPNSLTSSNPTRMMEAKPGRQLDQGADLGRVSQTHGKPLTPRRESQDCQTVVIALSQ
jgi:hypothetical protein